MQPFSFRSVFARAWKLYKEHFWILILIVLLQMLITPRGDHFEALHIISALAVVLLSFISVKVALMIVDGKEVTWNRKDFYPTPHEYLKFFLLLLAMLLATVGGFILLVIPGIYIMTRLYFSTYVYISGEGAQVKNSLKRSWNLVQGKVFWKVLFWILISVGLNILGVLAVWVGLLVTVPLTWLASALIFRDLEKFAVKQKGEIIEQSLELERVAVE